MTAGEASNAASEVQDNARRRSIKEFSGPASHRDGCGADSPAFLSGL